MTTAWTLPAQSIIQDALELIGVIGASEAIDAGDNATALTALQNILKELPLHGVVWPKITAEPTSLTWSALTPKTVTMPVDYFGVPVISFEQNSTNVDLVVINKVAYDAISSPDYVAEYPTQIYIAPNNVGYLYPVPSVDPVLIITYQAIALDAVTVTQPDVMQAWLSGLGLWLAYELCPKFGVDLQTRTDIERRYRERKHLMLAYAAESAPITFGVAD